MKRLLCFLVSFVVLISAFSVPATAVADSTRKRNADAVVTVKLNSSNAEVSIRKSNYVYTGKEIKPSVKVVYKDKNTNKKISLKINTDFTVTYVNNTAPGKAQISVNGINSYKGRLTKSFNIIPPKASPVKLKDAKITLLSVKFKKQSGVSGYKIGIAKENGKKYKYYTVKPSATTYKFVNLKGATNYKVKVCAFVDIDGKRYYGNYSKPVVLNTKSAVDAPEPSGYCDLTAKPVLEWKAVKNAQKYYVFRAEKQNGKYVKVKTTSKTEFTDKKAKVHKTYYYRVKSVRKKSGKEFVSNASKAVKVKAMKTVFVGDSVMEAVKLYKVFPEGNFVTKVGIGTYSFYNVNFFDVKGKSVTGVEKVISYKPDRVFIMLGMNEMYYKSNKAIMEYYQYSIEDIQDECKDVEIVILSVSPTSKTSDKTYPKKKRIDGFNKDLQKLAKKNNCKYYDFTAPFKDGEGNLLKSCDGGDGCHWNISSCRLFISQMEKYVKEN